MPKLRVRHAFTAILLLVALLSQGTWALAGVTGGVSGYVRDSDGAPVAGVKVTVSSPSEITSTSTDASGHFSFLDLAPDTYTVSATKQGYDETTVPGVTVFADQQQSISLSLVKLRTIANVRSQAASSLVKSGVGGDIYNVDPAQIAKTSALSGGADSAYSAMSSVPGLVIGTGGGGWNQAVVVRGNNPFFTGFEYDGIPVNRAFDNYTASTASNLGLQELQVYTGGGPASISSTGTSGFINQVIKTGTYPGYGMLQGALSAYGDFYHSARAEVGGASPNRNFSYYAGISGYNQSFREFDNNNGASYLGLGSMYAPYGYTTECPGTPYGPIDPTTGKPAFAACSGFGNGVFNACPAGGLGDPTTPVQGCLPQMNGVWARTNLLSDRESVVNLHFGLPRKNGQRDDLQLMWSASAMQTYNETAPNAEGQVDNWMINMTAFPYCPPSGTGAPGCAFTGGPNYPIYQDSYQYNLPFGTNIAPNGIASPLQPGMYYQANTPVHSFQGAMPIDGLNDLYNNDTGIVKAQYTHSLSSNSFLRLMGYSFFSDWTENGAVSGYAQCCGWTWDSPNYDLITHTAGGMLQYFNQINDKHLLQFTGNYTHSDVNRFNHSTSTSGTPIGLISESNGVYTCYDERATVLDSNGNPTSNPGYGNAIPCFSSHFKVPGGASAIAGGTPLNPIVGQAAANGAYYATLQNGNASGTFNSVIPNFYSASLADQWRPSDRVTINASVRYDQFTYNLAPADIAQNPFYAQIVANYACVDPSTNNVQVSPLLPGDYPPANPVLTNGACDAGFVHPDGAAGHPLFSLNVPSTYTLKYWEPRISGTYTQNPDTVWRFSAGRYAEPPLSAAVEYLYRGGSGSSLWTNFLALGTYSPFHPITGQTSGQYDFSLEKRIHGTPMSFKISPFYSMTSNWEQQSFIGAGFVTQIPVGRARSYGVEAQFNYGDFNKEGFSGLLSFTYTKSQVQFQKLLGANQVDDMNLAIENFNALTSHCAPGGDHAGQTICGSNQPQTSACYAPSGDATPMACSNAAAINNPYFNSPLQPLLDPNGWYDQAIDALKPGVYTGSPGFYNSPFVTNLVVNYRHQKLAITPSMQIQAGSVYGSPYDVVGVDPRNCYANQQTTGVSTGATGQNCDYLQTGPGASPNWTYLYVPNPQTGSFTTYGQYRQPTIAMANLQLSYDVSPKVTLQLTASDLWHTCFGGSSEPWTAFAKPSSINCGYYANGFNNAPGWYNGTSPADAAANNGIASYPWESQSYLPKLNNSIGGFIPFTLYLQAQVKL